MAENSLIGWTDHTFNGWRGCTKVSPGCANCYAETLSKRNPAVLGEWGPGKPRVLAADAQWKLPLKWNQQPMIGEDGKPRRARVFCSSLADWLDDEVPLDWLERLLALIVNTPNLDWLLLTKRPENLWPRLRKISNALKGSITLEQAQAKALATAFLYGGGTIMHNIWFGVTVENQAMAEKRIPQLLEVPAAVRFLSCEPLLGPVNLRDMSYCPRCFDQAEPYTESDGGLWCAACDRQMSGYVLDPYPENGRGVNWVIAGGESGPGARPMHPDWARSLRSQCAEAGVPFFFKQWGEWLPGADTAIDILAGLSVHSPKYHFWPLGMGGGGMVKVGKKDAGHLLDGEVCQAFPMVERGAR